MQATYVKSGQRVKFYSVASCDEFLTCYQANSRNRLTTTCSKIWKNNCLKITVSCLLYLDSVQ